MILSPFPLLHPYRDRLTVGWWHKDDDASCQRAATMVQAREFAHLAQMHGAGVAHVSGAVDGTAQGDAMVTATKHLLLLTKSADCQSFVFYCPKKNVVAVVHAGWKGLLANVIAHTVRAMREEHGVDPRNIIVGVGPSLGLCCAEFTDPAKELPHIDTRFFHERYVDLQGIADAELVDCGVRPDHIDRMSLCTMSNAKLLWSYRAAKDSVQKGHRNMLGAMLK